MVSNANKRHDESSRPGHERHDQASGADVCPVDSSDGVFDIDNFRDTICYREWTRATISGVYDFARNVHITGNIVITNNRKPPIWYRK